MIDKETMEEWRLIMPLLDAFLEKTRRFLTPEKVNELKAQYVESKTIRRYNSFTYGPSGIKAAHLTGRTVSLVDYELAAREWQKATELRGLIGEVEASLQGVMASREDANTCITKFASHSIELLLKNRSASSILASFEKKYFSGGCPETVLTCPLYGCALLERKYIYSSSQLSFEIRRPTKKDLGRPRHGRYFELNEHVPDAVLVVATAAPSFREHKLLEQLIVALTLFKPGCVLYGDYSVRAHSSIRSTLTALGGTGYSKSDSKMYLRIWNEDQEPLSKHLDVILPILAERMSDQEPKVTPTLIALNAYQQSLFENSLWERQVANAVMAIESLLMGDGNHELRFRAACRTAKLCAACGYDPIYTRDATLLAYDVRSAYVHGNRFTAKEIKKIQRFAENTSRFCQIVCDLVRCMLVAHLTSRIPKAELQIALDDSMLSEDVFWKLHEKLGGVRQINRQFALTTPFFDHFLRP